MSMGKLGLFVLKLQHLIDNSGIYTQTDVSEIQTVVEIKM